MLAALQAALLIASVVAAYLVWVRPVLRSRPSCAEFYMQSDSCIEALRERFAGIKGKLVAALGMAASAVVGLHDFVLPLVFQVDWTPIRAWLPDWAWPILMFSMFAIIKKFREYTDRRAADDV